ncbi:MAG: peptidoglycan-binding protein [Rhodospirillales bacterium]|nr:peptidoglycan-binding protein [Rhodospirillales bacterium]
MTIELSEAFVRDGRVDEFDTMQVKRALNRLGYYTPYEDVGITGIPDDAVFEALKAFQADSGLPATGALRPGDESLKALNAALTGAPDGFYIWRTVGDGKVRPAHAALNGTVRSWRHSHPNPGEDYNCRCWAEPTTDPELIYPDAIRSVYPEVNLLPLVGAGRLYSTWRIWLNNKNPDWVLGEYKSKTRWANQLKNRDWTPEQITETIKYGKRYPAPNKVNKANTATRYEYKGRFVVRDDQTKEVLQISGRGFTPNKLP